MEPERKETHKYPAGYELPTKLEFTKEDFPKLYEVIAIGYTPEAMVGESGIRSILRQDYHWELVPEESRQWLLDWIDRYQGKVRTPGYDLNQELKTVTEGIDNQLWKEYEDQQERIQEALKITDDWERTKEVNRIQMDDPMEKFYRTIVDDYLTDFFPDQAGDPDKVTRPELWQERMMSIIEGSVNMLNLVIKEKPDSIVYLDKSTRPFYWILKGMWKQLRPAEALPRVYFLNIGLEKSRNEPVRMMPTDKEMANLKTVPLGEKVLVLDEFSFTGVSLGRTKKLLKLAQPAIQVKVSGICKVDPLPYALKEISTGLFDEGETHEGETISANEIGMQVTNQHIDSLQAITFGRRILEAEKAGRLSEGEMNQLRAERARVQAGNLEFRREMESLARKIAGELRPTDTNKAKVVLPKPESAYQD